VATYCQQGDLPDGGTAPIDLDCSQFVPGDTDITCGTITPTYGVDCAANTGTPCGFQDGSGNPVFSLCQGGPGAACAIGASGATCVTGAPTCALDANHQFTPQCLGSYLAFDCQVDQLTGYDCASFGGSCANVQCINLAAGAPCDLPDAGQTVFVCGSALSCTSATDGGGHFCN
jgi:hypothetical protein